MKYSCILTVSVLLLAGTLWADDSDGFVFGPNRLRGNPSVSTYLENDKGIPVYVEGSLLSNKTGADEAAAAVAFFEEHKGAYKMVSPADELTVNRIDRDRLDMSHVRLRQNYRGVPVVSGNLIAHFTPEGVLKTVNGYYFHDIDINVIPIVTSEKAITIADDDLRSFFGVGDPARPELVVFPWENTYYLCWRLFIHSDTPMGRWEYFVDAKSGEIVYRANRIMNENDIGTGYGVMGGFRDHIDTDFNGTAYQMRDYTRQLNNNPHGHDGQMPDGNYIQTNIAGGSLPGSIATDADNYWDDPDTQRPAVDGQVYSALFYDWLLAELGRNSFNGSGATMLTSVNYSAEGDNNAYWNGNQIVVWSWSSGWRSLAGCPDVIAHEWGHAVTDYTSDLVYQKEPGALNESFSDMIGTAFEWAHPTYDTPDWDIGENGRTTGVGFRSMEDPHLFGDPDYYGTSDPYWIDVENCTPSWSNDYCGVHTNSGVGNKWFFLLSDGGVHHGVTVTGIGVADAMAIAYRANAYYWNSNTDYHEAALGTISAADDLDPTGAWATQVGNAWNAVGVSTPGPDLVFDYPEGIPETVPSNQAKTFEVVITGTLGGSLVPGSGQIHYALNGGPYASDPLAQITSIRYQATLPATDCGDSYEFYVSAEEAATGVKYDPDPSSPHTAFAADSVIVVFEDDFQTDKGWTVSGSVVEGDWERAVPSNGGSRGDPPDDYDGSGMCYVTDNGVDADIDGGTTYLDSPAFDLSSGDATVSYARWYSNDWGNAPHTDTMKIYISSNGGTDWTLAETVGPVDEASGGWIEHSFPAGDFVSLTSQMKLRFEASDLGDGSVVEAGLDAVRITRYACGSLSDTLRILTETLPDWTAGFPYSYQLISTGGQGTHMWADKYDDLIGTGLSLTIDGLLYGTPLAAGTISFTAEVVDQGSNVDQQTYSFTINDSLLITSSSLPDWTTGVPYSYQLESSGGTGAKIWSATGNLSDFGLSLSPDGLITGAPTGPGIVSFDASVSDQTGMSVDQLFTFDINSAVQITTAFLPDWTAGVAYSEQIEASGGTGGHAWTDAYSDLTGTGLGLSPSGELTGVPTAAGPISFTALVQDAVGSSDEALFEFTVNPEVSISTDSVPEAELGTVYSYQFEATGGTGGITWVDRDDVLSGSGLSLSGDGLLSGTPVIEDEMVLIVRAEDGVGGLDERQYTLTIVRPYMCGDANGDETINVADAVYMISYVFSGGPAPEPLEAGDANCDGTENIADAVYIVAHIFGGGPPPCCP